MTTKKLRDVQKFLLHKLVKLSNVTSRQLIQKKYSNYLSSNLHHSEIFSESHQTFQLIICVCVEELSTRTFSALNFKSLQKLADNGMVPFNSDYSHAFNSLLMIPLSFYILPLQISTINHDASNALPANANIDHFNELHTMPHRERFLFAQISTFPGSYQLLHSAFHRVSTRIPENIIILI